jgi:biopolymer transport protein ExbB
MQSVARWARSWFGLALLALVAGMIIASVPTKASAAEEKTTAENVKPPDGVFIWVIRNSGIIGAFILVLSIYFTAMAARFFVELKPDAAMPPEVLAQCEAMLEQRDFKGIFNVVKEDDSFFSRVLVTGITELPNGLSEAREAMERIGDMLTTEMEKKISFMAVFGTLGPMIGLLGTLSGMIHAFYEIAQSQGNKAVDPSKVANAISEALLLTFEGVLLAIVSIVAFSFFRNRVLVVSVTTMTRADEFLRHFAMAARGKPGGGGAGSTAPARPATKA